MPAQQSQRREPKPAPRLGAAALFIMLVTVLACGCVALIAHRYPDVASAVVIVASITYVWARRR